LANPTYIQDFSYISCSIPDREDYIVDDDDNEENDNEQSDLVALVLNLAYVDDRLVEKLEIKNGFSIDIKKNGVMNATKFAIAAEFSDNKQ